MENADGYYAHTGKKEFEKIRVSNMERKKLLAPKAY